MRRGLRRSAEERTPPLHGEDHVNGGWMVEMCYRR